MANLKEVRARIKSVQTTQQITKAMKLVSASKLKRAQDRITQMRPYADHLYEMLGNILSSLETEDLSLNFNEVRTPKKITIILVTASKGLCGAFNSNLIKKTNQLLFQTYNQQRKEGNLTLYVIGKKGYDAFKNKEVAINTDYQNLLQNLNYEECASFTETLMKSFLNGDTDVVECVYAKFKNAATQVYESERFLPVPKIETSSSNSSSSIDFIFDPEKTQLIEELVPKIIKTQFFRFLLDTNASEHGARMVAMDSATTNANELLNKLKLMYNRERQAAITKELLEIVAGAAALENG